MNRYTDHDKNFGPITIARNPWKKHFSVILTSGGGDEEEEGYRNHFKIQAFGWFFRLQLPNFIRPFEKRTKADWDEATIARLGRDYYSTFFEREYGFQFSDGDSFSITYGVQSGFGDLPRDVKEKSKHWFLPWAMWRHVRTSFYDQNGELFWSEPDTSKMSREERSAIRDEFWEKKDACPKVGFWLRDYDGDLVKATTFIEEREWKRGEKWCSWLSLFWRPKIRRDLDIQFDRETGKEKGSWKGGVIGTGIQMVPGDTHESAMRRYCEQEHYSKSGKFKMAFLGTQQPVEAEG